MTKRGASPKKAALLPNRQAILRLLKQQGPRDSESLAAQLSISAMAVRQHLYALCARGWVTYQEEPRRIGRPAKMWRLTPAAEPHFPDSHARLTVNLLSAAQETFGKQGVQRLVTQCAKRQFADYLTRIPPGSPIGVCLEALVAARNEEGFMAEVHARPDGSFLLMENHCPISAGATACPTLCEAELDVFRKVLGHGVTIKRLEHMIAGNRRCVYCITPASGKSPARQRKPGV